MKNNSIPTEKTYRKNKNKNFKAKYTEDDSEKRATSLNTTFTAQR